MHRRQELVLVAEVVLAELPRRFITGQSVFRTGLSKVGLPAAPVGLRAEDPTIAELLKNHGYSTSVRQCSSARRRHR
jgi:hypothetical protein